MNRYSSVGFLVKVLVLAEIVSIIGHYYPSVNTAAFFMLALLTAMLSWRDLRYGAVIMALELITGSKGYLFFAEFGQLKISGRMAVWSIIMVVWLIKAFQELFKDRKISLEKFFPRELVLVFTPLLLFVFWGGLNGILRGNGAQNVFLDQNGWIYFACILPLYAAIRREGGIEMLKNAFIAATLWLSIKTLILLYFFSHEQQALNQEIYRWVRETGVGEITKMQNGFYRIFFQSHIYSIFGIFASLAVLSEELKKNGKKIFTFDFVAKFIYLIMAISVIFISFSRSFWAGIAAALPMFAAYLIKVHGTKVFFRVFIVGSVSVFFAVIIIAAIVKFPLPRPTSGFDPVFLTDRASQLSGEAGVSSRWSLLPKLMDKVLERPIMGSGFGATVTYESSDPRVLEQNPSGEYTTYAFEWGWIDIWYKLGIFGLASYVFLAGYLFYQLVRLSITDKADPFWRPIFASLGISLACVSMVSFFSPYLNHPLGIGFLVICALILSKKNLPAGA